MMLKFLRKKIGIIGYGNMGSAIASRIKPYFRVYAFDKEKNKVANLSGIKVAENLVDLADKSDVIILAVKPQDFDGVLNELKPYVKDKLVISIAAGITTGYIEKILGQVRVVRAMPNLPVGVGKGMTWLYKGKSAEDKDLAFSERLFCVLGKVLALGDEKMIFASTAASGSGPGFLCDLVEGKSMQEIKDFTEHEFIPSLAGTAESIGFTPAQAKILAETTGWGTVKYLEEKHLTPGEVKNQVASRGGTTEAGLIVLRHDVRNLPDAVEAAKKRAEELSRED